MTNKAIEQFKQLMEITVDNAKRYQKEIDKLESNIDDKTDDVWKSNVKNMKAMADDYTFISPEVAMMSDIAYTLRKISHQLEHIEKAGDSDGQRN